MAALKREYQFQHGHSHLSSSLATAQKASQPVASWSVAFWLWSLFQPPSAPHSEHTRVWFEPRSWLSTFSVLATRRLQERLAPWAVSLYSANVKHLLKRLDGNLSTILSSSKELGKWRTKERKFVVGEAVLVVEPNLPRYEWRTGRVYEVFPGDDGLVRVVRTPVGTYLRPIYRLCLLEPMKDLYLTTLNRTRGRMERRNLFELPLKFSLPNFPCCQEIIPPSSKQRCCNQVTWREGVIVTSVSRQKIDKLFSILQPSCYLNYCPERRTRRKSKIHVNPLFNIGFCGFCNSECNPHIAWLNSNNYFLYNKNGTEAAITVFFRIHSSYGLLLIPLRPCSSQYKSARLFMAVNSSRHLSPKEFLRGNGWTVSWFLSICIKHSKWIMLFFSAQEKIDELTGTMLLFCQANLSTGQNYQFFYELSCSEFHEWLWMHLGPFCVC